MGAAKSPEGLLRLEDVLGLVTPEASVGPPKWGLPPNEHMQRRLANDRC